MEKKDTTGLLVPISILLVNLLLLANKRKKKREKKSTLVYVHEQILKKQKHPNGSSFLYISINGK